MARLYSAALSPSPRRVRIFLAEKGVEVAIKDVDLGAGEQHTAAFRTRNPCCTVPVLELDDGTCITESDAICLYFEALHPEPSLMGHDARSQALIRAADRWVELNGYLAVVEAFRNGPNPRFDGRAVPGPHRLDKIPALVERGIQRYQYFLADLDAHLRASRYVALDHFSIADITAMVTLDFGHRVLKYNASADLVHLHRWYEAVAARPSAAA